MDQIKWTTNKMRKSKGASTDFLSSREVQKARAFHKSFPGYLVTPLCSLDRLASFLDVGAVYVKDESYRFGLNAFKVLGASFAIAKYLASRNHMNVNDLNFSSMISPEVRRELGDITFVTATDGNHGRGVAWAARQLEQKAVVYMPKGSSQTRLDNIRAEGATASITDLNYDDAVRLAAKNAQEQGWVVVQDTAWEGYEDIPTWIMQGYATIASETMQQLDLYGLKKPTHLFVQAGVGSFAGSLAGYFVSLFGDDRPKVVVVEPNLAACLFKSAMENNGEPWNIEGHMPTIMAGLACGEPNAIAWNILRDYADMFFSCPDWVTTKGMRILGNPLGNDRRIISGESGAVTAGLLATLLRDESLNEARDRLQLDARSRILLVSTEGDTDPARYRSIVWDGEYPSTNDLPSRAGL
jgi:diaminopropionate ammonia-lyase